MLITGIVCLIITVKLKKSTILKAIFLAMIIIPVGFTLLIRFSNEQNEKGYTDTGIMLKWKKNGEEFVYKGKTYKQIKDLCILGDSNAEWNVSTVADKKLVFNIEPKKTLMDHIFGSNEKEEVYLVKNALNVNLYEAYGLYGEENVLQKVKKYYEKDKNFDFYLHDEYWEWIPKDSEKLNISAKDFINIYNLSKEVQTDLIIDEKMQKIIDQYSFYLSPLSKDKVIAVDGAVVFKYHDVWYVYAKEKETENDLVGTAEKIPMKIANKLSDY
jgi:hypothetical protein